MRQIILLEESVASRIAAGEVVERPVSVAKELLENSIDADAQNITISLEQGGKSSLIITDDGTGIPFEELPLAVERYATSKIRSLDDLERVSTLGYRGEALSSVAAVSRLEIRSRISGRDDGGMILVCGGETLIHQKIPSVPGTRIQVDDLFFNMPARRKFLKSSTAELKRITKLVQDYALARPNIRFRVESESKRVLDIGGSVGTDEIVAALWGEGARVERSRGKSGDVSAQIWYDAMPGSRRMTATIFVNGRRVQDATVRSAISSAGASAFGEWIVMIEIPPEEVDVNIHPAKSEVRFRRSGAVFEAVRRAADQAMKCTGGHIAQTVSDPVMRYIVPDDIPYKIEDGKKKWQAPPTPAPVEKELFSSADAHPERRFLGQTQTGYLVFDDAKGLCLLDAHAAHERILYEEIEDAFSEHDVVTQKLLVPQEIPAALVQSVASEREILHGMGFTFALPEDDGRAQMPPLMLSLPAMKGLARMTPIELLRSALIGIEEETDPSKRDREVWWRWARTACRDAVKLGDRFEAEAAMMLFDKLERCRVPYSCPHGRPTTIFLTGERLKTWFER